MNRIFALLLILLTLFLTACTDDSQAGTKNKDTKNKDTEKLVSNEKPEEHRKEELQAIEQVVIPTSLEEWKETKPGLFAKGYSFEQETSVWPKNARELTTDEREELIHTTEIIKDDEQLFKMLLYYFGSNVYSELIDNQMNYTADFNEPYLPKPTKETISGEGKEEVNPKAMLLLDASSSMLLPVDGKPKMEIAKTAMKRFANTIGSSSEVSLYIYGHAGSQDDKDKELSCSKVDEVYPMQAYSTEKFNSVVDDVVAKGWTPLAAAIKKANETSKNHEGALTVYIVSDGAETCDGDPIKEAEEFAKGNANRKVNIIGFNVDQKGEDQLKAVAKAGNGEYISADSSDELNSSIEEKWVIPSSITVAYTKLDISNAYAIPYANLDISKNAETISSAITNEQRRLSQMVEWMELEEIITVEQAESLRTKVQQRKDTLSKWNDDLSESQMQTVQEEYDRIQQKIDDWAEEVDKLRSEQS